MSRYYSQQYARLDDPDWNPNASSENLAEPQHDNSSYEPYRSNPHEQQQNPFASQTALPSAYLDSKYPQPGFHGLKQKSKGWFAWSEFSRRKKLIVAGSLVALIVIIAIIIAASATLTGSDFKYTPSNAKVTNEAAFQSGGATRDVDPPKNNDGIGSGEDTYTYYQGDESNFPPSTEWISYQQMWSNNLPTIQGACSTLGDGSDDTSEQIKYIADAIKNISAVSLVDHRFILAIIMQESQGCVHVGETTSSGGVTNPGLMQSHNGHTFHSDSAWDSILQMVADGTQGTENGAGLVYGLNQFGNPYSAARYYNSGVIADDGNLSETDSGTPCYVSDVANRLTGWTTADNTCPDN